MRYQTQDRIRKIFYLVQRWWLLIVVFLLMSLGATYWATQQLPARYQAFATLEVKTNNDAIRAEDFDPNANPTEYLSTQLMRLKSGTLIETVLEDPILVESLNKAISDPNGTLSRKQLVQNIQDNTEVSYLGDSRILRILYTSSDRNLSAHIPNLIVKLFESTANTKTTSVNTAERKDLDIRIEKAKEKLERSERTLVNYATQKGILSLPSTSNKESLSTSTENARLKSLQRELDSVKSQKEIAQKAYDASLDNNTDLSFIDSPKLQVIKEKKRVASEKYEENLGVFGENHPEMLTIKQNIERFDLALEQEVSEFLLTARGRLDDLIEREASLTVRIDTAKRNINKLRSDGVKYARLQRDVQSTRSEYEGLLERVKALAAETSKDIHSISVLDYARPPLRPVYPVIKNNLLWAALASLMLSFFLVGVLSLMDDRVSSPDDIIDRLGLPLLGVVPKLKGRNMIEDLFANPLSIAAEAYSTTRTRIENLDGGGSPPKCIQVTSTRASEGKSVTSLALARSYAVVGYKTLLIDADLRLPSFQIEESESDGLAGVLINKNSALKSITATKLENLSLLEAGEEPEDPAGLLGSSHIEKVIMDLRNKYDRIIIDGPPVLGLSDALLLSRLVDGTIIVTQSNALPLRAVNATITAMKGAGKSIIGVVITKYKPSHGRHSHHYSKYTYGKQAMKYGQDSKGLLKTIKAKKKIKL